MFDLAASARIAIGLRSQATSEIVLSLDSYDSLFVMGDDGFLALKNQFPHKNSFKAGAVVGCGVCYNPCGQPTGQITLFSTSKLDGGNYKHLFTVDLSETSVDMSGLMPFVAISDEKEAEKPSLNTLAVSRVPNAGDIEPLLDLHPQLLQAPIAQLRAFGTVAAAIEQGAPLPLAFRIVEPHKSNSALDLTDHEGGTSCAGSSWKHPLLNAFRGGAFAVSVACSVDCIATVALVGTTDPDTNYLIRLGPDRKLSIGTSVGDEFHQAETVLAETTLAADLVPTFQTLTLAHVTKLLQDCLAGVSESVSDCDADLDALFNANVNSDMNDKAAKMIERVSDLETELNFQLSDFGVSGAEYFLADGPLPFAGLTVAKLADHFYSLFNADNAARLIQEVLWIRLAGQCLSNCIASLLSTALVTVGVCPCDCLLHCLTALNNTSYNCACLQATLYRWVAERLTMQMAQRAYVPRSVSSRSSCVWSCRIRHRWVLLSSPVQKGHKSQP